MKVIKLSNRIIFVDDIVSIYEENKCGEFQNYTNYYIDTKYQRISVNESDYKKVQDYLLSLNEPILEEPPKEEKTIEPLDLQYKDIIYNPNFKANILMYCDNLQYKINEIIKEMNKV